MRKTKTSKTQQLKAKRKFTFHVLTTGDSLHFFPVLRKTNQVLTVIPVSLKFKAIRNCKNIQTNHVL